jgi:predicted metal-dependent peptidase
MTAASTKTAAHRELRERLANGLRLVTVAFPHFAGLVRSVHLAIDERVPTMGVFASGRLVVNPAFAGTLKENELVFVLAHELFHLALRTHDRARGSDALRFNYAHDYIINDILRDELSFKEIPAGGLDMPGARAKSAEEILLEMEKDPSKAPRRTGVWRAIRGTSGRGGSSGQGGDVLDERLEAELFPGEGTAEREAQAEAVRQAAAKALALGTVMDAMKGRGRGANPAASSQQVAALRGLYRPPWEKALQRWLESVAPGERTYIRPSRRDSGRTDVVLPGRKREGWILNVVLDTSGSMTEEIPKALGAIADCCDALGVDQVRLVQCDAALTADRFLSPEELAEHEITGGGGSDLSPALHHLAEDPRVEAVIVLTDGEIAYPQEAMPYGVLWVLPANGSSSFQPPYGSVIMMKNGGIANESDPGTRGLFRTPRPAESGADG